MRKIAMALGTCGTHVNDRPMRRATLLVMLCIACAAPRVATLVQNIKVSYSGADEDATASGCADFSLTPTEAEAFFARAKVITGRELHEYTRAPCYVRGTGTVNERPVSWEIRAAGTANVSTDETTTLLADPTRR